jgi:hypothetical protein
MHFLEHGVYEVKVVEQSLIVDATGPFNQELALHYQASIESCIRTLESMPWSQLIVLHNLSLFTPDAETVLIETLINRKKRGLTKSAVVLVEIEGKSLVIQQMSHAYSEAGVDFAFFDSIDAAKAWLTC